MRFEKINDNKLQIILSNDELPNSSDLDEFVTNSEAAREAFLGLLDQAEEAVGFHTQDYKIKIDARAMLNGEFVFTITKLIKLHNNEKLVAKPKKISSHPANATYIMYQFFSLDDFGDFCDFLSSHEVNNLETLCESCTLYKYGNSFYLALKQINEKYEDLALFNSAITEFSKYFSNKDLFIATLKEHGEVYLKDNAILTYQKYM